MLIDALLHGLVSKVVPDDQLETEVEYTYLNNKRELYMSIKLCCMTEFDSC